jgi:hypothetical protein
MCTELYKRLRNELYCLGLASGSFHALIKGGYVNDAVTEAYVQIVKDSRDWVFVGLSIYESSLQDQTIVLTVNEFYSRFLQHTVTL